MTWPYCVDCLVMLVGKKMDWNAKRAQTGQGSSSLFLAESSSLQHELPGKRRAHTIPLTLYWRDLLDLLTTSFENPWFLGQLLWLNLAFDVAVLLCGALPRRDVKLRSYIQSSFLNSHEALRIRWRTWQVRFQEISTWRTSFKKRRHALQPSISSTYWTVKAISGGVPTLQIWGKTVTRPKKAPLKIVNSRMIHLFLSPTEEVSTKAKCESVMEKKVIKFLRW